jgi:Peptidase family M1 domain/Bacterial Ig-like domain
MFSSRSRFFERPVVAACALVSAVAFGPTSAAAQVAGVGPDEDVGCGKARAMLARGSYVDEDPAGLQLLDEAFSHTDLTHCDLEIELFPATSTIAGTNTMTLTSTVDGLVEFTFRLRNNMTITAATINGSTPIAISSPTSTTRVATLDRQYDTGEVFTVTISYRGAPASGGFGSFKFGSQGGYPLIETLSEPYYSYTWWPVKDGDVGMEGDNSEKFTLDLAVIAPDTLATTSNGVLAGIDPLSGGRARYRWTHNYPISAYLVAFATTNYFHWTKDYVYPLPGGGTGSMPVQFNVFQSSNTAGNRAAWEKSVQMLETFRGVYGLYPFINEKYGIYQFTFGGGMEHQTNTGQGTFSEWITAHEAAHQWWGDAVTCKTWHDIWLNEGFATYGEALWAERKPGSSGAPALHAWMAGRRPNNVNGSVYVYDTTNVGRIFSGTYSYRKAGWVLHQLRHVVGDAVFFDILAAYRAQYEGSAATTDDFAAVASSVAGRDLTQFFAQWVYGVGAPQYAFGSKGVSINGKDYLALHIRQTQPASYGLYQMPIDVRVNQSTGNRTYVVQNDALTEHFLIPLDAAPTGVVLDEFNWILNIGKTSEAYRDGPPKVVASLPMPGDLVAQASSPTQIYVVFSEPISAAAGDFGLVETGGGAVPFSLNYVAGSLTVSLMLSSPLPAGNYTLTIADTVRCAAGGLALDGEMVSPNDPLSLPSGEGLPGGSTVIGFTVEGSLCYADCDQSSGVGVLDIFDFLCFQDRFVAGDPYACDCDTSTGAGVCDIFDFLCFQDAFVAGCP